MMFKFSKHMLPAPVMSLFRINSEYHDHYTRQSNYIHTPIGGNEAVYKTFKFHATRIWNHISVKLSTDVSYACFKHLVKNYVQHNMNLVIRLNK